MDEKIKQTIEEMELVMHNALGCRYFNTKEMKLNNDRFFNREATALYNAGYRKESDTAREIYKILEKWVWKLKNEKGSLGNFRFAIEAVMQEIKEKYSLESSDFKLVEIKKGGKK